MSDESARPAGPPAGWYPSQNDPHVQVYWDGAAWTGQTRTAAPTQGPPGTTRGTGTFAGKFWNGSGWVNADGVAVSKRSTASAVGGVLSLIVAVILLWVGLGWFQGFMELDADGNQFSGMLALLGLGAWVVAAAFGIAGIVLVNRK